MKKILVLLSILAVVTISASAQDEMHDPKAKEILDKVSEKAKSYSTIKAVFSYTLESPNDGTEETKQGEFAKKGGKYKVSMMGTEIYFDGIKRYTYIKDAEECQITKPAEGEEDIMNPNYIFNFYKKDFKYKLNGEKTDNGKTVNEIDLFPEQPKDKQYTRIRLMIEKGTNHIHSLKYFGRDGTTYTIMIKSFKFDEVLNDNQFFFDCKAHPEVDCIDLE